MREPFDPNVYYHVYNRGVDKRKLFLEWADFRRFLESMFLFNDADHHHEGGRMIDREVLLAGHEVLLADRKPLVSIVSYCLKSNHFHLLLRASTDDGISRFLHRLGMGYANYFNLKYARKGRLYEGPFKAKPVQYEDHLQLLPRYIHLNALDGSDSGWRNGRVPDWDVAMNLLEQFPWSSHRVYVGRGQHLPVVDEVVIRSWFPTPETYLAYLKVPTFFGAEEPTFTALSGSKSRTR